MDEILNRVNIICVSHSRIVVIEYWSELIYALEHSCTIWIKEKENVSPERATFISYIHQTKKLTRATNQT